MIRKSLGTCFSQNMFQYMYLYTHIAQRKIIWKSNNNYIATTIVLNVHGCSIYHYSFDVQYWYLDKFHCAGNQYNQMFNGGKKQRKWSWAHFRAFTWVDIHLQLYSEIVTNQVFLFLVSQKPCRAIKKMKWNYQCIVS